MLVRCEHCGSALPEKATICHKCGNTRTPFAPPPISFNSLLTTSSFSCIISLDMFLSLLSNVCVATPFYQRFRNMSILLPEFLEFAENIIPYPSSSPSYTRSLVISIHAPARGATAKTHNRSLDQLSVFALFVILARRSDSKPPGKATNQRRSSHIPCADLSGSFCMGRVGAMSSDQERLSRLDG